ncbi:MAG: AraC-like DNA-binding protein [Brevundimonas sp.]|jgi:AraC-like DNA-binding protein|uniref:helix-turn-helix domain-containing protein n=1 Tax=Brevundimonas sp. TaxID=1871086 RepID=UPI0039E27A02
MIDALAGIGAALGLFLLLILAVKRPRRSADVWLATWLAAQTGFCAALFLGRLGPSAAALPALVLGQAALVVLGPAQLLYAVSVLERQPRYAMHAIAPAAALGLLTVLVMMTPMRATDGALTVNNPVPWLAAVPLAMLAMAAVYPVLVLRLVARRRAGLADTVSNLNGADPGWIRLWAFSSLTVLASLLLFLAAGISGWPIGLHLGLTLGVVVAHLAFVGHRGLTRTGVFFAAAGSETSSPRPTTLIDPEVIQADHARVDALLARERPHLDPDLTAAELADRLGWAPERLTMALRQGGGLTFFDAINAARVREVQALSADPANAEVSLLALAHDAGFGSKSAFYDAFRRHTGTAPAAWRRLNRSARD